MRKRLCQWAGLWMCWCLSLFLLTSSGVSVVSADAIGDIIQQSKSEPPPSPPPTPRAKAEPAEETAALPRQAKLPTIIIDPGHGGKDAGAIGHRQVREKDIVLQLSKKLAKELQKQTGATVVMTRDRDHFITLDKRDEIAVAQKADLFVSIHANAASRQEAAGIEIYYLNNATDEAAQRLARRENRTTHKSRSAMEEILSSIVLNDNTIYSRMLAERIHNSLKADLAKPYKIDRLEIKSALFYVLVGSKAPSVLLEVGFITNPQEAQRLKQAEYQDRLVKSVSRGISDYFKMLESKKWAM